MPAKYARASKIIMLLKQSQNKCVDIGIDTPLMCGYFLILDNADRIVK